MKTIRHLLLLALALAGTSPAQQPVETLTDPQKATMRASLGLGTAATAASADFAAASTTRVIDKTAFRLVLVGDSILAGVTSGGATAGNYIADRLPLKTYFASRATIVNASTAGRDLAAITAAYAAEVYPLRPAANGGSGPARVVLLCNGGTNGGAYTVANDYDTQARADGFEVWRATLLPRGAAASINQFETFNVALKNTFTANRLIDLGAVFKDATITTLFGDNLHPTNRACDMLAEAINEAAWSDSTVAPSNFGNLAKFNTSDPLSLSGNVTIAASTTPLTLSGQNSVSMVLDPNGTTTNLIFADAAGGTYGWDHFDGSAWQKTMRFSQGSTMRVAFAGDPVTTAQLAIHSTTRGFLPPRMTKLQRDGISLPAAGLMVYQTDNTPGLRTWNGTNWMRYTETAD